MLSSSPLMDLVRAGALVMLLFAAILIWVVIRNLEAPIKFGTAPRARVSRRRPRSVRSADLRGCSGRRVPYPSRVTFRVLAGFLLPVGLYLMRPLTSNGRRYEAPVDESDPS